MGESVARLNDEQWGILKAALDGEIADLQRQLQQAQEWRDTWRRYSVRVEAQRDRAHRAVESLRQSLTQLQPDYEEAKAERDEAIERGKLLWDEAIMWQRCAIQFADDLDDADDEIERLGERAEAAEEDAKAQRALAERWWQILQHLAFTLGHQAGCALIEDKPCDCDMAWFTRLLTPAEAQEDRE